MGSAGFEPAVTSALASFKGPEARMLTKLHHDPGETLGGDSSTRLFSRLKEIVPFTSSELS